MKRIAIAAILLASSMLPVLSHDGEPGGGGGGTRKLRLKPFVSAQTGAVSAGFVNIDGRFALALRKRNSTTAHAGANLVNLASTTDGEGFALEFDINPDFVQDEFSPYFEVTATSGGTPYTRYFYLPLGTHSAPYFEKLSHVPVQTTTSDGWKHLKYGHHGCFDANDEPVGIGHHDPITSIRVIYDIPGSRSSNTTYLDNVAVDSVIAIER